MELTFLGTGGSQPIPLPSCDCDRCKEAREKGAPYTRYGCSLYLPELAGMIDASEFAPLNLNRWNVPELDFLFLTHWHPDHLAGIRALSMRPAEYSDGESHVEQKRRTAPTVVTTRTVYERACETNGTLQYLVEDAEFAEVHFLDEAPLRAAGFRVESLPYPLAAGGPLEATGFLFNDGESSLAVVADDARHLDEGRLPDDLDVAVFECGHFTHAPDGDRIRPEDDGADLSHEEVRERVRRVAPDRAYLSHISHHYGRSYGDFQALESEDGTIRFPHDGLTVTF